VIAADTANSLLSSLSLRHQLGLSGRDESDTTDTVFDDFGATWRNYRKSCLQKTPCNSYRGVDLQLTLRNRRHETNPRFESLSLRHNIGYPLYNKHK
jgi:hypothetical protein